MKLKPYQHIAGCSLGTRTDRQTALEILDFIYNWDKSNPQRDRILTPDDMVKAYRELAELSDDNIDPQDFVDLLEIGHIEPLYTYVGWRDGELRILPNTEHALENAKYIGCIGDEYPTNSFGFGANPEGYDFFLEVNDHGNMTLYNWVVKTGKHYSRWEEVWSVV